MDHRTFGRTQNCKGCRYWSEMIAKADSSTGGEVVALCLAPLGSPRSQQWVLPGTWCAAWASGHDGAVLMGSILASLCDRDRAIFETWKALMSKALKNTVTDILGVAPEMREEPAPEHERAGHA